MTDWDLDAVLVGLVILEEPLASELTDEWIATPRWRESASILLRHQRRGGQLGNLIVAGEVLRRAHCDLLLCDIESGADPHDLRHSGFDLPWTAAADAVCAVADCPSPTVALAEARRRVPILQLRRLVRLFETLTTASLAGVFDALPAVRAAAAVIEANVARFQPRLPMEPEPPGRIAASVGDTPTTERHAAAVPLEGLVARALGLEV
jgi:hypothetical protein